MKLALPAIACCAGILCATSPASTPLPRSGIAISLEEAVTAIAGKGMLIRIIELRRSGGGYDLKLNGLVSDQNRDSIGKVVRGEAGEVVLSLTSWKELAEADANTDRRAAEYVLAALRKLEHKGSIRALVDVKTDGAKPLHSWERGNDPDFLAWIRMDVLDRPNHLWDMTWHIDVSKTFGIRLIGTGCFAPPP